MSIAKWVIGNPVLWVTNYGVGFYLGKLENPISVKSIGLLFQYTLELQATG